jgi:hypothetical protein
MTTYSVTVIFDCTQHFKVDAGSPEEAREEAYDRANASLCHQCSEELDVGDPTSVAVHTEHADDVLLDYEHEEKETKLRAVADAARSLRDARGKSATVKAKRELAEALARLDA